ncbi:MAG: type II secretion system F family protein, partial [Candidatus Omnitrophica bacterium]|nr:type II secretion system F family protein [Candidatus Omnitrophota bacterium]
MANFKYKARDKFGKLAVSTISADNKDEAAKKLKEMGYIPVFLSQVRELRVDEILKKFKSVRHEDLNTFTRQLYSLQKAGVPLLGSLDSIASQTRDRYFKLVIEEVAADIKAGMSLSESLSKQPQVFDGIYISMIKAAETGGALSEILDRLTNLIEQEIDTKQRIKSATRYPLIAFCALILGFVVVVAFVIPRFATLYSQFDTLLPLPTRILIAVNVAFQKYWLICLLVAVGGGFGFSRFIKSKFGRPLWDNFKLKIPVLGKLLSMLIMSRFARVTAILMRSG